MAGRDARLAARAAVAAGEESAADLAGSASIEGDLPASPFSIGIHPWQLGDGFDLEGALREVETAPAWALGEIGLDYAVPADHPGQKMVFAAQLRIASEREMPVVLHCVRALEPTVEILSGFRLPAVIFHGFVGSREQAAAVVRRGYYLSFGERSLGSPKTVEAMRATPPERLLLETDDSPVTIAEIYARAAGILNITPERLARNIFENYARLA